ncbi:hypothetical protein JQ625_09900 [Bradyrhizobium diazoefficiens]|nr:hypothetical protein [Bradyrhizobium diazoefficiens]MBR0775147.1 hypothetical protein [Bradyrhizobium diazoefficiens]
MYNKSSILMAAFAATSISSSALAGSEEASSHRQRRAGEKDVEFVAACKVLAKRNVALPAECAEFVPTASLPQVKPKKAARDAHASAVPPPSSVVKVTAVRPAGDGAPGDPFLMMRQDQYDQVSYVFPYEGYQVLQGASFSYSDDFKAKSQSVSVKAFAGYSAYNWEATRAETGCASNRGPGFLARYGFGPFLQANGNLSEPMSASERSALRMGFDAETYFCDTAVFQQQDLQFLPYAQTDFRGRGSIGGFDALWEPYYINDGINLGGRLDVLTPKTVGYYFRLMGEANVFRVNDPGLTNFLPHSNYALIGGNAELRAVLFENDPSVGAALCGTISFIGSTKYLWDAVSQKSIYQLGAEVDYRLGGKSASTANCPSPSIGNGSTSIALSYNKGTDPMTFVKQDVYKASLKFAY